MTISTVATLFHGQNNLCLNNFFMVNYIFSLLASPLVLGDSGDNLIYRDRILVSIS